MDHLCYFCLALLRLFVYALWSPAGKGLTSWLSFVMSNCDVVTFPLVSLDMTHDIHLFQPFIPLDYLFKLITKIRFSNNSFKFIN